jgi:1-phosphofructokinase family hexose kinase
MILTVTLNPAIDKILILNHFEVHKLHRLKRDELSILTPGGKGVNIAQNLRKLGNEVITTGFAAGHSGHMLCDYLHQEGITTNFIFTEGNTRTNTSILDRENETLTEINDFGQKVSNDDIAYFLENFERLINRVKLIIIAGSLPVGANEDIICTMIKLARKQGKKTILHTNPDHTECYLASSPYLIVPDMRSNHVLFGKEVDGISKFLEAGRYILTHSPDTEYVVFIHRIENVVVISREKSYILRPRNLQIVNMLGYGDAYISGFVHAYLKNKPLKEALVYASAAGLTDVEDLYKEIRDISLIESNMERIDLEEVE